MPTGQRLLPQRLELDLGDEYMTPDVARFIKNLSFFRSDTSEVSENKSSAAGKYKPLESTIEFDPSFRLPAGYNHFLGAFSSKEENCIIFHYYNDNGRHGIYYIEGDSVVIKTVYIDECLNYQLKPENFIHEGGAWLEVFKYNDPSTGLPRKRSYYNFTDGYNYMRFICIEDAIATNGFDATLFQYFINPHPKCLLINAGLEPPKGCIEIEEVTNENPALQNNLKFNTWQFMVRFIDVYGRPSEWSDVSDIYIPGSNDCIGSSDRLARCLDLTFDAGSPLVNIAEIAFRNCNDPQWYKDNSIFLYKGSNLGDWWMRPRNPAINYNPSTNKITYRFCKDKECNPIAQEETNRTENPLPRITQSVAKMGKFLSLWDNLNGFFPFEQDIMDKVSLTVTPPSTTALVVRNIEIFVPIINPYTFTQQPIYKDKEGDGRWVWGGRYTNVNNYVNEISSAYKQHFGDDDRNGFIGYLAGTGEPPNSTVSELYYVDSSNEMVKVEDFDIVFNQPYSRKWYLRFAFNSVAPATYVFRIASHLAKLTDDNFQHTSTYTAGSFAWANKTVNPNNIVDDAKELVINVCDDNYSSLDDTKVLAIYDLTNPAPLPLAFSTKVTAGYSYEKAVDAVNEFPVELLKVNSSSIQPAPHEKVVQSQFTDHNGFYFVSRTTGNYQVEILGMCGCNNYKQLSFFNVAASIGLHEHDFIISSGTQCPDYSTDICNRILVTGKVVLCDSDVGVPGVGVVLTRGSYAITGADGTFTLIAHDNNYQNPFTRIDKLYYVPTICAYKGCDDGCLTGIEVVIYKCDVCTERTFDAGTREVKFDVVRGLLSGGNYGVAIWGSDWLGRHQFAQTKDSLYFTTPTLIQTNVLAPSTIALTINPAATFPDWVDEIKVGITKELSMGGVYMTWIVDRVEFIDNSGKVNTIAPTQIKIYYGSLIEYNKQNNFNTTTGWQFIVQNPDGVNTDVNQTSDFVEFYINGDGQFFPTLTRALIKYDKDGQYFLIDYDTSLKDLEKYAYVRLGRPLKCSTQDVFYQICGTIKVINGKAQQNTIILNAFDTYYKYRQIPIPVGTPTEPENVIRTFGTPFEHHSPSDLWGDHCINIGKVNARNPYESEIIRENQAMLSGALSVNGQLNYLNYFDEALSIDFKTWNFGGVVSAIPFIAGVRVICQYNCFTVGFNDNTLRTNQNGQIIMPSAESRFGNPEVSIGNNYGCSFFDKNTIRQKDGLIQYVDIREGVLIQDNYAKSVPVSKSEPSKNIVGGVNSWLLSKIKYIQQWNRTNANKKYFIGTINPAAKEYWLTDFTIRGTEYINNEREVAIQKHETICFDFMNGFFREFVSPTPQGYGYIEGQLNNIQLFSFSDKVYTHYTTNPDKTYNTFYGVVCSRVIRPVIVIDGFQKKQFANVTVMGKHLYYSDYNRTESNQQSRILIAAWKQGDFYWNAPILCNALTPADTNLPDRAARNILDGDKMYGSIFDIRLVGNPADDTIYTELLGIIVEAQAEGKVLA